MAHDVFISYATSDKPVADAVCATLESRGIRCWIAPRDVLPGTDWGGSIVRAVSGSRAMVLVFSSHANASAQVKREVNLAIDKNIPIMPFRIENVMPSDSLEYYLDVTHWLDALTPPLEQHLEKLSDDVARLISNGTPEPPPPPPKPKPKPVNKALIAAAIVGVLALAAVVGVLASKWSGGGGNDNSIVAVVTPTPTTTTPTVTPATTPTMTPATTPTLTPTPTPTPAVTPTPPPTPELAPEPAVVNVLCSPPANYELRCRATPHRASRGGVSIYFRRAGRRALDGALNPGECAWMDRAVGAAEPDRIDADLGMVQDLLPFLRRDDFLFSFCAKNAGDHFVISKAGRVK